jgi:SAM-dependent methyltransferase
MEAVPYDVWADYYRLLLSQIGARPRRLLDVCCGTGIMAERMALHGCSVVGIDLSPGMVRVASDKARATGLPMRFEVADATNFDLGETFDGAFSFFDSLNYITTAEGLLRAIGRVGAHVEPGGSFVFDLNTAYAFEKRLFDQEERCHAAPIRYSWRGDYDRASRLITVSMAFERDGAAFHETHVQRAHPEEEVREALARAGFRSARAYDSYTLDPPRKRSDRIHFTAVKE